MKNLAFLLGVAMALAGAGMEITIGKARGDWLVLGMVLIVAGGGVMMLINEMQGNPPMG